MIFCAHFWIQSSTLNSFNLDMCAITNYINHQGHHCSRPENTRIIYTKQEYSSEAGWEKGYRVVLREVRRVDTSWSRILSNLLQYGHFIEFYYILLALP